MKRLLALFLMLVFGCSKDEETPPSVSPDVSRPECENLNPLHCLAPWPSSRYLVPDGSTPTGRRISLPIEAMPKDSWGTPIDPSAFSRFDGFSPMTSIVTVFPGELDTSNLPAENRIPESQLPSSPTVLLDAASGERVPHFSEINEWDGTDFSKAAFYIRPAVRLKENHRYIVAARDIRKKGGGLIEPSDYFRALRDKIATEVDELAARRPLFEDIFAKLEAAGVERAALIQAWDFHTASGAAGWSDLLHMRDDGMMRAGARGLGCTTTSVAENVNDRVFRRIEGTFTVPLYMEHDRPGAKLHRGADGKPAFKAAAEARFVMIIPHSVKRRIEMGGAPVRVVQYGHGLMGEATEVQGGFQRAFFDRFEMVGIATEWWGMSEPDTNNVAEALGELARFPTVAERLMQGVLNQLVLTRSLMGVCGDMDSVKIAGRTVYDPNERYFFGISQGSIMGTTTAALSQDITRFILNVGGISYPIMIIRSVDFPDYNKVIQAWYPDKLDTDIMLVAIASFWDLAEPATYAPHLIRDPLPGTPAKRVMYTIGRYDAQVPNVASDIAARTIGLPLLTPSPYEVYGVPSVQAPADSAYVIYDMGAEPVPLGSKAAAEDNVAHSAVRRAEAHQLQADAFMRPDGVVRHFCNGACDPD